MNLAGRRVHLMGIGGAGVGALATVLRRAGALVDGCDVSDSPALVALRAHGIPCAIGHHSDHVGGAEIVVHTAAIASNHPELRAARAAGATVLGRGEFLAQCMVGARVVAITGSHGKTTTTWFTGHLLAAAGADPTVIVGGTVASLNANVRCGSTSLFVAEADESDGSFARIAPHVAVVTNLDHEHLRHYGSFAQLVAAMQSWLRSVPADGLIVVPAVDFPPAACDGVRAAVTTCGIDAGDWHFDDLRLGAEISRGTVMHRGVAIGVLEVPIPGAHMALNALMAMAAAHHVHASVDAGALANCERVRRRFSVHGKPAGVRVIEDYAHHPAEVRATIAAARLAGGRVHVLFQAHRPSRTQDCWDEFLAAFDQAHALVLTPIYCAGEEPIAGYTHQRLAEALALRRGGLGSAPVQAVASIADGVRALADVCRPGDTCVVMGAGDIGHAAPKLVEAIARHALGVPALGASQPGAPGKGAP